MYAYMYVLGHDFAPFAFQEPCFGFVVVSMLSYTFIPKGGTCGTVMKLERRACCLKMLCSRDGTPPQRGGSYSTVTRSQSLPESVPMETVTGGTCTH